jgi:hypothetical protein
VLILAVLKTQSHPTPHNSSQYSNAPLIPLASSLQIRLSSNERTRQACRIEVETDTNGRQSKTFTWEWEDGETGEIRTIKIPMPDLDRDYDPSESREIILDRKLRLDNVEMPDWIEIIPPRKPN